MVESQGKMSWPGWHVKILHRDIAKKRGQKPGGRDKKSRGNRGGGLSNVDNDSE